MSKHLKIQILKALILTLSATLASAAFAAFPMMKASRPLPVSAFAGTSEPQQLMLLNSGIGSLEKRLQMIEAARKTIDVEFYIYKTDLAGRLFTQALIKKAQEGSVKVRVLVDSAPFVRSLNQYAQALRKYGIEVRFYNDSFLLDIQRVNHRSHRKTLIVDGEQAITGGRNVADEYFDMSETYNFIDRDVYVQGSLVSSIQQSFDDFWGTKISEQFEKVVKPEIQKTMVLKMKRKLVTVAAAKSIARLIVVIAKIFQRLFMGWRKQKVLSRQPKKTLRPSEEFGTWAESSCV